MSVLLNTVFVNFLRFLGFLSLKKISRWRSICSVLGKLREFIVLTLAPKGGSSVIILHRPLRAYWVGLLRSETFCGIVWKADHCTTRQEVPKPPTVSEMKPVILSEVMNGCCDTQGIFFNGERSTGEYIHCSGINAFLNRFTPVW